MVEQIRVQEEILREEGQCGCFSAQISLHNPVDLAALPRPRFPRMFSPSTSPSFAWRQRPAPTPPPTLITIIPHTIIHSTKRSSSCGVWPSARHLPHFHFRGTSEQKRSRPHPRNLQAIRQFRSSLHIFHRGHCLCGRYRPHTVDWFVEQACSCLKSRSPVFSIARHLAVFSAFACCRCDRFFNWLSSSLLVLGLQLRCRFCRYWPTNSSLGFGKRAAWLLHFGVVSRMLR